MFSKSVADALLFCKNELKLEDFAGCDVTVTFILIMNDVFDILNSRDIEAKGYKQAMCNQNIVQIKEFYIKFVSYIKNIKLRNGTPVLNSERKTGFLGLIIALNSTINIYEKYIDIDNPMIKFIPIYKLGQDHIKLFFGKIRSHCGNNDNPTAKQFIAAYKKLLVYCEIKDNGLGNCVPLQEINILNCSSATKK